jgi:integrase
VEEGKPEKVDFIPKKQRKFTKTGKVKTKFKTRMLWIDKDCVQKILDSNIQLNKNALSIRQQRWGVDFTFHDIRHTCFTNFYDYVKDFGILMSFTGHTRIESALKYVSFSVMMIDKAQLEAVKGVNRYDSNINWWHSWEALNKKFIRLEQMNKSLQEEIKTLEKK